MPAHTSTDLSEQILREKPKERFQQLAATITTHAGTCERCHPKDLERNQRQLVEMFDELFGLAMSIAGIEDADHVRRLRSGESVASTSEIAQRSRQLRQR